MRLNWDYLSLSFRFYFRYLLFSFLFFNNIVGVTLLVKLGFERQVCLLGFKFEASHIVPPSSFRPQLS